MSGKWHGKKCPVCGKGFLHDGVRVRAATYQGVQISIDQPGAYCDTCEDGIVYIDANTESNWKLKRDSVDLEIRQELATIRLRLGLTQQEAAKISGGGHNAFSRYERGEAKPLLGVVALWRLLGRHPELLQELLDCAGVQPPESIAAYAKMSLPLGAYGKSAKFVPSTTVYVGSAGLESSILEQKWMH